MVQLGWYSFRPFIGGFEGGQRDALPPNLPFAIKVQYNNILYRKFSYNFIVFMLCSIKLPYNFRVKTPPFAPPPPPTQRVLDPPMRPFITNNTKFRQKQLCLYAQCVHYELTFATSAHASRYSDTALLQDSL